MLIVFEVPSLVHLTTNCVVFSHILYTTQLGGVLEKSDGNCYVPRQMSLDEPVDYQGWNVFDYPSLGQVQEKLRDNNIILVVAARSRLRQTYEVTIKLILH